MRRSSPGRAVTALLLVVGVVACGGGEDRGAVPPEREDPTPGCAPAPPEQLRAEVVRTVPHDPDAFTQGLLVSDGALFESTGLVGESTLRELDPATGDVKRRVDLPAEVFGEGLAVGAEGRLVQLTWKDGVAYEWDRSTFELVREHRYDGEGWGLTTMDGSLVMSDGSDVLVERDVEDFEVVRSFTVRRDGGPADRLNELEWDGRRLWANRFETDEVVRIDPECGSVDGVLDVAELRRDAAARLGPGDQPLGVPNGVAHVPGTDRYLLTGKRWPVLYEVTIRTL